MAQSLCNAPATFQRATYNLLGGLKMSYVLVYLEEITVFSQNFIEYFSHLRAVFDRLQDAGINPNTSKCSFF